MSGYLASFGWQAALVFLSLLCIGVGAIVVICGELLKWHAANFRRIPRKRLVEHRITPAIPRNVVEFKVKR
jgi:hypothetical protein